MSRKVRVIRLGALDVAGDDRLGDDPLHAGARDDQALPVLPQPLEVEERIPAVLFAFGVRPGNQAVKVAEAGLVFGQDDLVVAGVELLFLRRGPVAGLLVGDREVGVVVLDQVAFDAEDGLDAGGFGLLLKFRQAVDIAVVGQRQRGHAHRLRFGDEVVDLSCAVEKGKRAVVV